MKIFFIDENDNYRCIGSRELNPGERIPENATVVPVEIPDGHEAFFNTVAGAWTVQQITSSEE